MKIHLSKNFKGPKKKPSGHGLAMPGQNVVKTSNQQAQEILSNQIGINIISEEGY